MPRSQQVERSASAGVTAQLNTANLEIGIIWQSA